MDSLQGIPVEYKLDTFNMPRTGITLCHSKTGYVSVMLLFRSRHLAIYSPLGQFNGDNAYSPPQKYQTHETHGDIQSSFTPTATWLLLNYSEHNPSHVWRHALPSQPSQLLITQFRLNTHNLSWVLQHQKQTQYSMLQIKPIPKNTFRLSASYFFILPFIT